MYRVQSPAPRVQSPASRAQRSTLAPKTGRAFKDTLRALEHLMHSESTQRALRHLGTWVLGGHSGTWRALRPSEGIRAFWLLRHLGTRTLRALRRLSNWALKALRHLDTQAPRHLEHLGTWALGHSKHSGTRGTLFSRLLFCQSYYMKNANSKAS